MKRRRSPKNRKYRRKRLIVSLAILIVPAILTSLVFALQQDFSGDYTHSVDLTKLQLSSAVGNRGTVYDKNLSQIATSYHITSVYARPTILQDSCLVAEKLATILPLSLTELKSRLKSKTGFVLLAKDIDSATAAQITALKIEGLSLKRESKRQYPYEKTGAHIIGFANDTQGLDGIEFYYDSLLRGGTSEQFPKSIMGTNPPDGFGSDGVHLILTLDIKVQEQLQNRLAKMIEETNATAGIAAIMIPESGAVIAIANLPTFDPNTFWDADEQALRNRFITDPIVSGGLENFLKQAMTFNDIKNKVREKMEEGQKVAHKTNTLLLAPDSTKKRIYDFDNIANIAVLNELIKKVTRQAPSPLDLPTLHQSSISNTSQSAHDITALQLLTEFSSITIGGNKISPHLLHAVFDEATGREYLAKYGPTDAILNHEAIKILEYIGKKSPENNLIFESVISAVDHEYLLNSLPDSENVENCRYPVNYAMLSFIPSQKGSLALIFALDRADLFQIVPRSGESSIPKSLVDKSFFQNTQKWALTPAKKPSFAMLDRLEQLRPTKMKIKISKRNNSRASDQHNIVKMPEITGRSLRQGLQVLQNYSLKISVSGSGIITSQKPKAGTNIQAGDMCSIQLSANR